MASGKQDIGLIWGLAGGGTLQGATGQHVRGQLTTLVNNLNSKSQISQRKLTFSLDTAGTRQNIAASLQKLVNSLGAQKLSLKLNLNTQGGGGGGIQAGNRAYQQRLSIMKSAYALLTKMDAAERGWTAARFGGTTSGEYSKLKKDRKALDDLLNGANVTGSNLTKDKLQKISEATKRAQTTYTTYARAVKRADEDMTASSEKRYKELAKQATLIQQLIDGQRGNVMTGGARAEFNALSKRANGLSAWLSGVKTPGLVHDSTYEKWEREASSIMDVVRSAERLNVEFESLTRLRSQISSTVQSLKISGVESKDVKDLARLEEEYKNFAREVGDSKSIGKLLPQDQVRLWQEGVRILSQLSSLSPVVHRSAQDVAALNGLLQQVEHAHASWTKAASDPRTAQAYKSLIPLAEKIRGAINGTNNESLAGLRSEFKSTETLIKGTGNATKSLSDRLGGLAKKFGTWFSLTRVIMAAVNAAKKMVTTVIEIDSAMTQLKIVTGASDVQMSRFLSNSTALAKELGQSITDVLKSVETFSRLGYGLDESSVLAKYTAILSNVAGVSSEEATTGVTSIIKGFNLDVSETEHVANVLIEVGQKYAVSAGELMEAFARSGAALNATNTSFEKSAGLIAAANASVELCRAA